MYPTYLIVSPQKTHVHFAKGEYYRLKMDHVKINPNTAQ